MQACKPTSLSVTIGLARLYETRNIASKSSNQIQARKDSNNSSSPSQSTLPIKRLSPAELAERRAKGLCFNCNQKFGSGHRCKKLFLIERSWSIEEDKGNQEENVEVSKEFPKISINAIYGARTPQTMPILVSLVR
ncbi:hypothetical protein CFOL_v3_33879 [Cephalotus follicularis]|uniref:Uncharacterized protein n=1 Tax=Cephalotus follicularis TaxID=3775 RepID=A0A1Q3DDC2_CEPFO|nr:hypothetical protein CFOL_v3_33879 [Cephalotus follicularis]